MGKELSTRESTDVALSKSKSFMDIIKNIFNNKVVPEDDSWMQRLWDWADENDIPDFEVMDEWLCHGLPRDKENLLNLTELNIITDGQLTQVPKEIQYLTKLTKLGISNSQLVEFPKEIILIPNLTELDISSNNLMISLPCVLTLDIDMKVVLV